MDQVKKYFIGILLGAFVSGIGFLWHDYNRLRDKEEIELKRLQEIAENKETLRVIDSIFNFKRDREAMYKTYFDTTINSIKEQLRYNDRITREAIKIAQDTTEENQIDSIYNELIKKTL